MAINEVTSIDVKTLPPFKRLIMTLGELPTSYLESMTYAELLMWFCNFLQEKVLPTINNNADALQEVITYLENLDLQDEVNNKLDEMADEGTLQEIVAEYLNSKAVFGFDTVASMKEATNLINGSYAKTMGYHSKNDGGMATYKVREITNDDVVDEATIIALNEENLVAELIFDKSITPEQFGCYGDNIHDDTINLQKAINYIKNNSVILEMEKTYLINEPIEISGEHIKIDGEKSTITYSNNDSAIRINGCISSIINLGYINAENGNGIELYTKNTNSELTSGWSQYVTINFLNIRASDKCIYFNRSSSNNGWINEIRINNGKLETGNYGIWADAKNLNAINNISINNVGFEGITTGIYLANNCFYWNFNNCRYAESFTTLIHTVGDIRQCMFNGSVAFPINKVNISELTSNFIINAPINDSTYRVVAYNGCFYEGTFRPQIKDLEALNLNRAVNDSVVNYVMPSNTLTDYIIIGSAHNTSLETIKLNKAFATSEYGDNKFAIKDFILQMNFATAQNLTIYDANNHIVFNQGHNYTKAYLKFTFITNVGWICEKLDQVPTQ